MRETRLVKRNVFSQADKRPNIIPSLEKISTPGAGSPPFAAWISTRGSSLEFYRAISLAGGESRFENDERRC